MEIYPRIIVCPLSKNFAEKASIIGERLKLPVGKRFRNEKELSGIEFCLLVGDQGLFIQKIGSESRVSADFSNKSFTYRIRSNQSELLLRAIGSKKNHTLRVIDATAGLGRDSFVMANLGCYVVSCERNLVISEMLDQAIKIAIRSNDSWLAGPASRISLQRMDVRKIGKEVLSGVNAIYLDPMFPEKKSSAAANKEIEMLKAMLGDENSDTDSIELLEWALDQQIERVVVKRPIRAELLGGRSPSHQLFGKTIRYDVHQKPSNVYR